MSQNKTGKPASPVGKQQGNASNKQNQGSKNNQSSGSNESGNKSSRNAQSGDEKKGK